MYVCIYIYIYVYMHTHAYIHISLHIYIYHKYTFFANAAWAASLCIEAFISCVILVLWRSGRVLTPKKEEPVSNTSIKGCYKFSKVSALVHYTFSKASALVHLPPKSRYREYA